MEHSNAIVSPPRLKNTWAKNIAQAAFPLVFAFSSAVACAAQDEQKIAGLASQAGSFLANEPGSEAAGSIAAGIASSEASSQLQQWFSRFGTARVHLNTDKNFSLKNSQFDLLVPLYDGGSSLFFTQGSFHRTDDRNQANIGAGMRWFNGEWVLGGNTFLDRDLSRKHTRAGMGMEYWRDFLKLGANSYLRISDWKDSQDVTDYEARPANGWDVRAQAWLPALPQLGGKLIYEQYYGNEVALFGKDNRQSNPYAVTAGINYTPIPLLTFSAEQRQGRSDNNDTRFGIDMNFQLGTPWRKQVNPEEVAAMRSLAGNRYDLVERNNNIVLEYRKKEVISLQTVSQLTGYEAEKKMLNVTVKSSHGLSHIDWSAPSLLAAGGHIMQTAGDYQVVLPAYQPATPELNAHIISGVAVDLKGNRSQQSQTLVTVLPKGIVAQSATFTPATAMLPADGNSSQVLKLMITDANNLPVDVPETDIKISTNKLKSATVSAAVKKDVGVYEVTVTAGTDLETASIFAQIQGVKGTSAIVSIVSAVPSENHSTIEVDKSTYQLDDEIKVIVTLKDAQGNGVQGGLSLLNSTSVKLLNAEPQSSYWSALGNIYTRTFVAKSTGTALKATLKLNEWSDEVQSREYAINQLPPVSISGTSIGNINHTGSGFPTTGFSDGRFTLNLSSGSASDFTWESDAAWVSVSPDAEVSFNAEGNGNTVTIAGTPINGGPKITYSFALKSWFTQNLSNRPEVNWANANAKCNGLPPARR